MEATSEPDLLDAVRKAKGEVEREVGDYRRVIAQLDELEHALAREEPLDANVVRATDATLKAYPGLVSGAMRAPSSPHEAGDRLTNLVYVANKLKELSAAGR
jgi:hypothetical protein